MPFTPSSCPATLHYGALSIHSIFGQCLVWIWIHVLDVGPLFVWFSCVRAYSTPLPSSLCCALRGDKKKKGGPSSLPRTRDLLLFLPRSVPGAECFPTRCRRTRGLSTVVFSCAGRCFVRCCPLPLLLVRHPSSILRPYSRIAQACRCELWSTFFAPLGLLQRCLHPRVVRLRCLHCASLQSSAALG